MTVRWYGLRESREGDAFEFTQFGAPERPFALKKHWFAARRSILGVKLRKMGV